MSFVPSLSSTLLWAILLFSPLAASFPKPTKRDLHRRDWLEEWQVDGEPCGQLFRWAKLDLEQGFHPVFPAFITYQCLISVPFNGAVALRFIDYFNTTIQFHSTLAYLRDPPPGYQRPAIDLVAELDKVKTKVVAGEYTREYDFEVDVKKIVSAVHDGHFDLTFGILAPFKFGSLLEIVSVSRDGVGLPRPYLRSDITDAQNAGWVTEPSPIKTINGQDAVEYLVEFARNNSFGNVESHADYNALFEHPAADIQLTYGVWSGQVDTYPGDGGEGDLGLLDITFEGDDDVYETEWWSELDYFQDPGPLETGGDMYNFFVLGLLPASYNESDAAVNTTIPDEQTDIRENTWADNTEGAYPQVADIYQRNLSLAHGGVVTGYFFDDESLGVLSLPTFGQYGNETTDFSDAVQQFIQGAADRKLTRVVIDLQQNTGGQTKLAFDTFKRFFPNHDMFAGSRRRSHAHADILGKSVTDWWLALQDGEEEQSDAYWELAGNEWVVPSRIDAKTGRNFESWEQYDAETEYNGDLFSSVERYNLSDTIFTYSAFSGHFPYGFGRNPVVSDVEVFEPENIVILTDGLCSSACSIFVEAMTRMGVRTLVVGGEPKTGPMQPVAGSRGARSYTAVAIDDIMAYIVDKLNPLLAPFLPVIPPFSNVRDHGIHTSFLSINLRDQIRESDLSSADDPIPLQFQYEAAHCRLFYTLRNIYNLTQLWLDTATASFDDPSLCVTDSTGYATPLTPGSEPPLSPPPIDPAFYANLPTEPLYDAADLANYTGPPPHDDGDLNSAHIQITPSTIIECPRNKVCDVGYKCHELPVRCHSAGAKPRQPTVEFCLPTCKTAKDDKCRKYDSESTRLGADFTCDQFAKMNVKKRGRGDKNDERDRFLGVCKTESIIWGPVC